MTGRCMSYSTMSSKRLAICLAFVCTRKPSGMHGMRHHQKCHNHVRPRGCDKPSQGLGKRAQGSDATSKVLPRAPEARVPLETPIQFCPEAWLFFQGSSVGDPRSHQFWVISPSKKSSLRERRDYDIPSISKLFYEILPWTTIYFVADGYM